MHAYQITLVTPEDVANGAVKGSTVYLHSQSKENPSLFLFANHPEADVGFPLELHQVRRTPEHDYKGTLTMPGEADEEEVTTDPEPLVKPEATSDRGAGLKFDGGKPQPGLLIHGMPRALMRVVDVLTFGAKKYEAHSWLQVENGEERYNDAKLRHMFAGALGETNDPESNIEHLAHEICNGLFLLEKLLIAKESE